MLATLCSPFCSAAYCMGAVQVLATTCEDGSCSLWHWAQGDMLHSLKLPAGALLHNSAATLGSAPLCPVPLWQGGGQGFRVLRGTAAVDMLGAPMQLASSCGADGRTLSCYIACSWTAA